MIKLRGGFESTLQIKNFNKKKLMRSGTVEYSKPPTHLMMSAPF
jgi:hypothetical protein